MGAGSWRIAVGIVNLADLPHLYPVVLKHILFVMTLGLRLPKAPIEVLKIMKGSADSRLRRCFHLQETHNQRTLKEICTLEVGIEKYKVTAPCRIE